MYLLVVCHVLCVAELNIWLEGIPSISWFSDAIANNILNLNKKIFPCTCIDHDNDFFFCFGDESKHTVGSNLYHFYECRNVISTWIFPCGIQMGLVHVRTTYDKFEKNGVICFWNIMDNVRP